MRIFNTFKKELKIALVELIGIKCILEFIKNLKTIRATNTNDKMFSNLFGSVYIWRKITLSEILAHSETSFIIVPHSGIIVSHSAKL